MASDGKDAAAATDPAVIAALKALPAAEVKPISGDATASEKSGYVAELVAYSALDDALEDVAEVVVAHRGGAQDRQVVLVVEDRALLHSGWAYTSISAEVTRLEQQLLRLLNALAPPAPPGDGDGPPPKDLQFEMLEPAGIGAALGAAGAVGAAAALAASPALALTIAAIGAAPKVVGAFADVVGMFRTQYSFAARTMSAQGTPLVAETARLLRSRKVEVLVDGLATGRDSRLLDRIETLRTHRWYIEELVRPHRAHLLLGEGRVEVAKAGLVAARDAVLKAAADGPVPEALHHLYQDAAAEVATAQGHLAPVSALVTSVDAVLTAVDAFLVAVTTPGPDGGDPPLLAAVLRESLLADTRVSHVLFVSIDSIGAETGEAAKRFATADRPVYIGGLQVSYLLLDARDSRLAAAGTVRRLSRAEFDPRTGSLHDHVTRPVGGPGAPQPEVRND